MEVIDNFLPEKQFQEFQSIIMWDNFPWFYNPGITGVDEPPGRFMFTHQFYDNRYGSSSHFPLVEPLLQTLGVNVLWRVKGNLLTRTIFNRRAVWHIDIPGEELNTAIYYVNTNNGCTKFKKGGRVKSVANRMVVFDGDQIHTGVSCTDEKTRVVINFNYV